MRFFPFFMILKIFENLFWFFRFFYCFLNEFLPFRNFEKNVGMIDFQMEKYIGVGSVAT